MTRRSAMSLLHSNNYYLNTGGRYSPSTQANVRSIRPAHGLPPRHLAEVLGRRAARDIPIGTPLTWELVDRSRK